MYCRKCGKNNAENAKFCIGCGSILERMTEKEPESVPEPLKEKEQAQKAGKVKKPINVKKVKLAVILTVALVLVISAVGIGSAVYLKLNSPLVKISRGFKDLLTSGEAHKYKVSFDDGYLREIECDFKADLKNKKFEAVNIKAAVYDTASQRLSKINDGYTLLHINEKEYISVADFSSTLSSSFDKGKTIKYNNYSMTYHDGELKNCRPTFKTYRPGDKEKYENSFFEILSLLSDFTNGTKSFEETYGQLITVLDDNGLFYPDGAYMEQIDLADGVEDVFGIGISSLGDLKSVKIDKSINKKVQKELKKCLTDEKWLEENLGLKVSKDGKTIVYKFDINVGKAGKALFDIFKPLLEDLYNQIEQIDLCHGEYMDGCDEFMSNLSDEMEELEYARLKVKIEMIKSQIISIDLKMLEQDNVEIGDHAFYDVFSLSAEISETDTFKLPDASEYSEYIDKLKGNNEDFNRQLEELCSKNLKELKAILEEHGEFSSYTEKNDYFRNFDNLEILCCPYGNIDYEVSVVRFREGEDAVIIDEIYCPNHKTAETVEIYRPKIDASNVKSIFQPLIYHYASLEQGIHSAIGIDYNKDYRDELLKTVCEQTDWTEMGIVSIYKFKTVKSAAEVKEIYKRYISDDVVDKLLSGNSNFFSYNNELYIIEGAKGTYDYDASSITYKGEKDGGYVVAIDRFLGNGAYLATESFLVKYIDGNFKIVKKLGEEKLHPTDYYSPNYSSLLIFDW